MPIDDRGWPTMEVVDYEPARAQPDRAEHARLRDAVVDAAKALSDEAGHEAGVDGDKIVERLNGLYAAVDALEECESKNPAT